MSEAIEGEFRTWSMGCFEGWRAGRGRGGSAAIWLNVGGECCCVVDVLSEQGE